MEVVLFAYLASILRFVDVILYHKHTYKLAGYLFGKWHGFTHVCKGDHVCVLQLWAQSGQTSSGPPIT